MKCAKEVEKIERKYIVLTLLFAAVLTTAIGGVILSGLAAETANDTAPNLNQTQRMEGFRRGRDWGLVTVGEAADKGQWVE